MRAENTRSREYDKRVLCRRGETEAGVGRRARPRIMFPGVAVYSDEGGNETDLSELFDSPALLLFSVTKAVLSPDTIAELLHCVSKVLSDLLRKAGAQGIDGRRQGRHNWRDLEEGRGEGGGGRRA